MGYKFYIKTKQECHDFLLIVDGVAKCSVVSCPGFFSFMNSLKFKHMTLLLNCKIIHSFNVYCLKDVRYYCGFSGWRYHRFGSANTGMPIRSKDVCCWLHFKSSDDWRNTKRERLIPPGMRLSPSKELWNLRWAMWVIIMWTRWAGKVQGNVPQGAEGSRNCGRNTRSWGWLMCDTWNGFTQKSTCQCGQVPHAGKLSCSWDDGDLEGVNKMITVAI